MRFKSKATRRSGSLVLFSLMSGFIFLGGACASEPSSSSAHAPYGNKQLKALLDKGRRVSSSSSHDDTAMGLTMQDSIFQVKNESATGAPAWILFDTELMETVPQDELPAYAQSYLANTFARFADTQTDYTLASPSPIPIDDSKDRKLVSLHFTRTWRGLKVRDAYIDFIFVATDSGYKLREILSRHSGELAVVNPEAPAVSASEIQGLTGKTEWEASPSLELIYARELDRERFAYTRATTLTLSAPDTGEDTREQITVTVENGSLELLEAYSNRIFAQAPILAANVHARNYLDPLKAQALALTNVSLNDKTQQTNTLGEYRPDDLPAATITLASPRVTIATGNNGARTLTADVDQDGVVLDLEGDDLRAVNAYTAIQRINSFTRRHYLSTDVSFLNTPVRTSINVRGSCNAFYTQATISLFAAGENCANMALVNDVIYHEWGHGLDDFTGRSPGIRDGAFSEGIGDILAAYAVSDSAMGKGFFVDSNAPVRQLQNTRRFPDDRGAVHIEGQIIGGAFWDLRVALIERYGAVKGSYEAERLFFRHLLTADSYQESYQAVLRLDDDDGNPATPSPNFCLITEAFASHGLAEMPPDCADKAEDADLRVDTSIAVAIKERASNGIHLMVAAEDAVAAKICLGSFNSCAAASDTWIELMPEGLLAEKTAFVTKAVVNLQEGDFITVFKLDDSGRIIGKRTVKFASR